MDVLECYGCYGLLLNVMKCCGMSWNVMDVMECHGMFWNALVFFGMSWNDMTCFGMFWLFPPTGGCSRADTLMNVHFALVFTVFSASLQGSPGGGQEQLKKWKMPVR